MTDIFLQLAANASKPKKADAATLIRELAARYAEDTDTLHELATLYTFFLPPAPKKAAQKDVWAWVCQAVAGPKDPRPYLRYVMADGHSIYATDGPRLHSTRDLREPGLYDPLTGAKVWDLEGAGDGHPGRFPDVKRIIPERGGASRPVSAATVSPLREEVGGYVRARVGFAGGAFDVNLPYWRQATEALEGAALQLPAQGTAPVRIDGYHKATGAEVLAVIMPMRTEATK